MSPLAVLVRPLTWTPSLIYNDKLPTCTMAGLVNSARAWAELQGFDLTITQSDLLGVFAKIAKCEASPEAIAATDGLELLDVLEYVAENGLDVGQQAPLMVKYSRIDPSDSEAIGSVIDSTGSAYLGVTLYSDDVEQNEGWDQPPVDPIDGGHCIALCRDPKKASFSAATWGEWVNTTLSWLTPRIDEAWKLDWLLPVAKL